MSQTTPPAAGTGSGALLSRRQVLIMVYFVLLLLVGVVLYQNWEMDTVRILFVRITMPRPVLDMGLLVVGFVLGVMVPWFYRRRRRRNGG